MRAIFIQIATLCHSFFNLSPKCSQLLSAWGLRGSSASGRGTYSHTRSSWLGDVLRCVSLLFVQRGRLVHQRVSIGSCSRQSSPLPKSQEEALRDNSEDNHHGIPEPETNLPPAPLHSCTCMFNGFFLVDCVIFFFPLPCLAHSHCQCRASHAHLMSTESGIAPAL